MRPLYTGTSYVNWQLRIPASFWGVGWARGEYGDAWKSTEWLVTVTKHRPKGKKWKEEWAFIHVDGTENFFNLKNKNKFLKEGRLTGVLVYVFSVTSTACNSHFLHVCAELSQSSSSSSSLSSDAPAPVDHSLFSLVSAADLQVASEEVGSMLLLTENSMRLLKLRTRPLNRRWSKMGQIQVVGQNLMTICSHQSQNGAAGTTNR